MAKFNFYLACIVAAFVAQGAAAPSGYGNASPAGAASTPCETVDAVGICVPATVVATSYATTTCTETKTATTTATVTQSTTVVATVTSASVVATTSICTETATAVSTVTVPTYTTTTLYVCPDCVPGAVGTVVGETPCATSTSEYEAGSGGDGASVTTEYAAGGAGAGGNYAAPTEAVESSGGDAQYEQNTPADGASEETITTMETSEHQQEEEAPLGDEPAGEPLPVDDAGAAGGEEMHADGAETTTTEASGETAAEPAPEASEGNGASAEPAYVEPIYDGAAESSSATNYRRRRRV